VEINYNLFLSSLHQLFTNIFNINV
jgi:hypothetical protein